MTEENLNAVEEKKCNCPVCKLIRSEETKKFLSVVLASFIGCSLALVAFAPKKHHFPPRHPAPCTRMMDRPVPPPEIQRDFRGQEFKRFDRPHHGEFRQHKDFQRENLRNNDENCPTRHKLHPTPQIPQQPAPEKQ